MKKPLIFFTILVFASLSAVSVFAQGMMDNDMMDGSGATIQSNNGHTAREEAEGKAIWEKLSAKGGSASGGQAKELKCEDLSDDDFGALGEYYMGQMVGNSHEAMNEMMIRMMGEEGEKQMHVVMGKRLSGCDTSAAFPAGDSEFMPMMQMMMGGDNFMLGNWGQSPMWWGGVGSWLFTLIWIVWLVVGILAAIWLWKQITKK